jgi:hypothetical protein
MGAEVRLRGQWLIRRERELHVVDAPDDRGRDSPAGQLQGSAERSRRAGAIVVDHVSVPGEQTPARRLLGKSVVAKDGEQDVGVLATREVELDPHRRGEAAVRAEADWERVPRRVRAVAGERLVEPLPAEAPASR